MKTKLDNKISKIGTDSMKKKPKKLIIILLSLLLCVISGLVYLGFYQYNKMPDGYIAVFNGGTGEQVYSTYIYKIKNGQVNYGFRYVNKTNTTIRYGSSEWKEKVTSVGEVAWTDDVFTVAKNNNAYDYVLLPGGKTVSIEEFQKIFLMD